MAGYSARLPVNKDPNDGFQMLKTIPEVAKQNFKMLLLTEPGERVWDKNYGVGLKRFLFEQRIVVEQTLTNEIVRQVSIYLPYLSITKMDFIMDEDDNLTNLRIAFIIQGFSGSDVLEI